MKTLALVFAIAAVVALGGPADDPPYLDLDATEYPDGGVDEGYGEEECNANLDEVLEVLESDLATLRMLLAREGIKIKGDQE